MPTNLNALIRYKQIDACLKNKYVRCTVEKLQEVCSEAIGEHRGVYKLVSERTIRDDIRVMRSDILGFNAPIKSKNGAFYYTEDGYSIFRIPITEKELLRDIFKMLIEEKDNITDLEFDSLLERISFIVGEPLPSEEDIEEVPEFSLSMEEEEEEMEKEEVNEDQLISSSNIDSKEGDSKKDNFIKPKYTKITGPTVVGRIEIREEILVLLWEDIFMVI